MNTKIKDKEIDKEKIKENKKNITEEKSKMDSFYQNKNIKEKEAEHNSMKKYSGDDICEIGCDNDISAIKPDGNMFNDTEEESLAGVIGTPGNNNIQNLKRKPFEKLNFKEGK